MSRMLTLTLALTLGTTNIAAFSPEPVDLGPPVASVFPEAGTSVPANGRIVLFGAPRDNTLVVFREDGTQRDVTAESFPTIGLLAARVVSLEDEGLVVGEIIRVEDRCDVGCDFVGEWTVGPADVQAPIFDDGALTLEVRPERDMWGTTVAYAVEARLPGARDDGGAVIAVWTDDDGVTSFAPSALPGEAMTLHARLGGGEARTVCFDAKAIDASGNETPFDEELCADLDPDQDRGCAQTTTSSSALFALLLVFMQRRRK